MGYEDVNSTQVFCFVVYSGASECSTVRECLDNLKQPLALIIKPTRCTNFSNFFWNKTLHVSDSSSDHHQEIFTVHTAMLYVIQVC